LISDAGKKTKGRKPFVASDDQRLRVRSLVGDGALVETIAKALGMSEPTLRKHFAVELADKLGASSNLFNSAQAPLPTAAPPAPRTDGRGRGGGRSPFKPDLEQRNQVIVQIAIGASQEALARGLRMSVPTFRKAFKADIATARDQVKRDVISWMMRSAKKGSVAAQVKLLDMIERARIDELDEKLTGQPRAEQHTAPSPTAPIAEKPLGKKLADEIEAQHVAATGTWSDLLTHSPTAEKALPN
jgi:AraC-like DNA-binding protein